MTEPGGTTTSAAGVLLTFGIHMLARRVMRPWAALLTGLTAAVCPALVVHAHYLKKDILFTICLVRAVQF